MKVFNRDKRRRHPRHHTQLRNVPPDPSLVMREQANEVFAHAKTTTGVIRASTMPPLDVASVLGNRLHGKVLRRVPAKLAIELLSPTRRHGP